MGGDGKNTGKENPIKPQTSHQGRAAFQRGKRLLSRIIQNQVGGFISLQYLTRESLSTLGGEKKRAISQQLSECPFSSPLAAVVPVLGVQDPVSTRHTRLLCC